MAINNTRTTSRAPTLGRKSWILIVLGILVVVALGAFFAQDIPMRARYSATVNELESVKKNILEPAGAVLRLSVERRGNGIIDTVINCGPDVACPTVGGVWYIPVEKGEDQKTLKSHSTAARI